MATPQSTLGRAEQLAERLLPERTPKKRMLVIVNPYATTVSDRLRNLVVYALESRYSVEAVDTEKRDHATQICREAAQEGYDVVVAFGGDGTVNEAANGLAGSSTPLTCLPGGATNVYCRTLGIPGDVVDATEHLLRMADSFEPRRVDLGLVNERYFTFSSGVGLDASVVERVDAHPLMQGPLRRVLLHLRGDLDVQPALPRRAPARAGPHRRHRAGGRDRGRAELGSLHLLRQPPDPHLRRHGARQRHARAHRAQARHPDGAAHRALARFLGQGLHGRAAPPDRAVHRRARGHRRGAGRTPFPVQVDGDFIGRFDSVRYGVAPGALAVVS